MPGWPHTGRPGVASRRWTARERDSDKRRIDRAPWTALGTMRCRVASLIARGRGLWSALAASSRMPRRRHKAAPIVRTFLPLQPAGDAYGAPTRRSATDSMEVPRLSWLLTEPRLRGDPNRPRREGVACGAINAVESSHGWGSRLTSGGHGRPALLIVPMHSGLALHTLSSTPAGPSAPAIFPVELSPLSSVDTNRNPHEGRTFVQFGVDVARFCKCAPFAFRLALVPRPMPFFSARQTRV